MRVAASVMGLVEAAPATHENVMASINNQYRRTIFCDANEGLDRRGKGASTPRDLDSPEFIRKPIVPGSKAAVPASLLKRRETRFASRSKSALEASGPWSTH
jgi:hypothetical protein